MDYYNYLKEYQNIPFNIFKNGLEKDSFFHAYLLVGQKGTPLLGIAKYLTKSIIEGNKTFFSGNKIIDKKVEENSYADLIILDGASNNIKIDDIRNLEDQFSKTATEERGIKIYIINMIENMNVEATNALLKFLEEPNEDTYAFLTTENEFRILPTIKSRSEIIHFSSLEQNTLINQAIELGTNKSDAELLSFFYNDPEYIKEYAIDETYLDIKNDVFNLCDFVEDVNQTRLYAEKVIIKKLNNKESLRMFFDILIVLFKESLSFSINSTYLLDENKDLLELLAKNIKNIEDKILLLMNYRNEINYNINTSLLIINMIKTVFGD